MDWEEMRTAYQSWCMGQLTDDEYNEIANKWLEITKQDCERLLNYKSEIQKEIQ